MAKVMKQLTSISPDLRTGSPPPGRRALALLLSAMLSISALSPALAAAGELDSEAEGIALPEQAPSPDFDPGGEESALAQAPATGGGGEGESEEAGAVEVEPELDAEAPPPGEVTSTATEAEAVAEAPKAELPAPVTSAEAPEPAPEPAPAPQPVQATTPPETRNEPVENRPLVAPAQKPVERSATDSRDAASEPAPVIETTEAPAPAEPSSEEAPAPATPQPATRSGEPARNLAGKRFYVVRPGDCLFHIAAALLPRGADSAAIEREVLRLWKLNEERIGTGDPNLIYAGTVLRLR